MLAIATCTRESERMQDVNAFVMDIMGPEVQAVIDEIQNSPFIHMFNADVPVENRFGPLPFLRTFFVRLNDRTSVFMVC